MTPKSFRIHIGIFGRRNAGKSSLLNALTGQAVAIVSEKAGTTTDPVEKAMEFAPIGPVLFIDTAGIDDEGALGEQRVAKTYAALDRTDLALLVFTEYGEPETRLLETLRSRSIPVLLVQTHADKAERLKGCQAEREILTVSSITGKGIPELRHAIVLSLEGDRPCEPHPSQPFSLSAIQPPLAADLAASGDCVLLVTPIDAAAPKGRLILPQVNVLRDLLDHGIHALVTQPDTLAQALASLSRPPALVITDSQAFASVASVLPETIPLTSFSILFARFRGDLAAMVRGAETLSTLSPGDSVLIAEACTHHPTHDDIGTKKIPALLNKRVGGELRYIFHRGHDFPSLQKYKLIIHCGACVWNRREMISRQLRAAEDGVPLTNYGITIAYCLGILPRALQPFK